MSSPNSEASNDDDDDFDDSEDDSEEDGIYSRHDYDEHDDYDFDDDDQISALIHSLLSDVPVASLQTQAMNTTNDYRIRASMGGVRLTHTMASPPISVYGDFIVSYLTAPPFEQRTTATAPFYLSDNLIKQPAASNTGSSSKLFVGNVPLSVTLEQLRSFFHDQGYTVKDIQLPPSRGKSKYAFVHFTSDFVAESALFNSVSNPSTFVLSGHQLRMNRPKPSTPKSPNTPPAQMLGTRNLLSGSYSISDIYYGTLITGAAMRNIQIRSSIVCSDDEFGVIGHPFTGNAMNIPFRVRLDPEKRRIALVGTMTKFSEASAVTTDELLFEWRFSDLKGKKIIPVLVDRTLGDRDNYDEIFLLMQVKRPPTILTKKNISHPLFEQDTETRLPGTQLIGHANTWLFRLSSKNLENDYEGLFRVLNAYNLTQRQFSHRNIVQLIGTPAAARKNLNSMRLLSNEIWMGWNREKVRKFLEERWPSYPFETKFEIMKLISKHIITVNDLVVDEAAERILKRCSISTLIACTDKIIEFAPRWLSGICDDELADWGEEEDQARKTTDQEEQQQPGIVYPKFDEQHRWMQLRSSTGQSLRVSEDRTDFVPAAPVPIIADLGTFSRLLAFSLHELKKKHELRTEPTSGMFVTKHELRSANSHPSLIRKVYITPSSIVYEGPYREEKCAVTRQYEQQQDQFLRVAFRDEDFRFLHNYNDNMTKLYERIKQMLIKGISVCDRKYEFVAFSSSQLREHSCWMFASLNRDTSANSIRAWMGDFRNIRPLAKYAARLGQSFSTSIKGIALESKEYREISDVERYDGDARKLCFTDGVGIIAPWLAERLAKQVKSSEQEWCPAAFQIRCGGYKGMVCLDVAHVISQREIGVYFRKSMNKFTANNHSIDVVRMASNPSLAYLNRQIILLLSSLGISDDVFRFFQKEMLDRSLALTQEPRRACQALQDLNEFGGNGCHAFLINFLSQLGKHKEPFTQRLLRTFQAFLIKELRTKAKILVPNSWTLFGVVDETGTLEYGQCFVQIHDPNRRESVGQILQGPVVVTRNPCFHPGDIRRLRAVDVPALRRLKNVIVFPRKGLRPHALEMSGGDLDGDTFWICSNEQLIFSTNDEPFDYQDQEVEAKKKAQEESRDQFSIEDVCNFFGEYIEADNLGMIANSHLALADHSPLKAKDERCLILARMHSVAVDFAKNGVSAPRITKELRPQAYPHFMEKTDKTMYRSTTILGKLYDDIMNCKIDLNTDPQEEINEAFTFPYRCFRVAGEDDYMTEADFTKNEYERELRRVMRQYGIKHEAEIVSGYILKFNSKQYSNQTKLFELRNEIAHAYRVIRDKYLHIFWREFYQPEYSEDVDGNQKEAEEEAETPKWSEVSKKLTWRNQYELLDFHNRRESCGEKVKQKASAWFRIIYEPWWRFMDQINRHGPGMANGDHNGFVRQAPEFFSFAWLVYPVLLGIYRENRPDGDDEFRVRRRGRRKNGKRRGRGRKGKKNANVAPTSQTTNPRK